MNFNGKRRLGGRYSNLIFVKLTTQLTVFPIEDRRNFAIFSAIIYNDLRTTDIYGLKSQH